MLIIRVSTDTVGGEANSLSGQLAVAGNGTKIAFVSTASNLVSGDTNGFGDVFVRDMATGIVTRVSTGANGEQANGNSSNPALSADGTKVVFSSTATNLVADDTNGVADIFVKDLLTGAVTRVSTDLAGGQSNGASLRAKFSPDGTKVAFGSSATNLVPGDTNANYDVFVKDLTTGAITRVSTDAAGAQVPTGADDVGMMWSPDGTKLAFISNSNALVAGDTNNVPDVFVKDLGLGTVTRVSTDSAGGQSLTFSSTNPVWSPDGTKIAFESLASNLVPGDTNGATDIFIKDLNTGITTRVSTTALGEQANGSSTTASFSPDGTKIAFSSAATNLVAGDANGQNDIFVKDLVSGEVTRVSVDGDGASQVPRFLTNSKIAFQSFATNLVPGDTNGSGDVFVATLETMVATEGDDVLTGTAGDDVIDGAGGSDLILSGAGSDTLRGGSGNDGFYFGAFLDATDSVDGGPGTGDQLGLQGNYGSFAGAGTPHLLGANNLVGVETLVLLSGNDNRFGDTSGGLYSYNLKTVDANVAAGEILTASFNQLRVGENVRFDGSDESDGAFLTFGGLGNDELIGGQRNDAFLFGTGRWNAGDRVDGQGGSDELGLQGLYTGANAVVFGANQITNVETLVLLSGGDTRFGSGGLPYAYDVTTNDGNVVAGQVLTVNGNTLRTDETLTFNGSAEIDGSFRIFSGAGNDTLVGSRGADEIYGGGGDDRITGGLGADILHGGAGSDVFVYTSNADSRASTGIDEIRDFVVGEDKIDLSLIDANTYNGAGNNAFTFIGSGSFVQFTAGLLRATNVGTLWTIEGDTNGDGAADFTIHVTVSDPAAQITADQFVL